MLWKGTTLQTPISESLIFQALNAMQIDPETTVLHSSEEPNLTSYIAASEHGVIADWRDPVSGVLELFCPLLLRHGVHLDVSDDDDPIVVSLKSEDSVSRLQLKGVTAEGADTNAFVFALDGMLPSSLAIFALAECDGSDGYGYVLLPRTTWERVKSILGTQFDRVFIKYPAAKAKALATPKPAVRSTKKINWKKDFDHGRRNKPSEIEPLETWWPVIDAFDPRCLTPRIFGDSIAKSPYNQKIVQAYRVATNQLDNRLADAELYLGEFLSQFADDLTGQYMDSWLLHGKRDRLATMLYEHAYAVLLGTWAELLTRRYVPRPDGPIGPLSSADPIWSYFTFLALGCESKARQLGDLISQPMARYDLRTPWEKDRPAYHDLALFLHRGERGFDLPTIDPIVAMADTAAWSDPEAIVQAVQCHAQKRGERFTHSYLRWSWPASLYALARRCGARDKLPTDNPFLNQWCDRSEIDFDSSWIRRLQSIEQKLASIDESTLPPIIAETREPMTVPARVVAIEKNNLVGTTALHPSGGPEHPVRGTPAAKKQPLPGELWKFKITSATYIFVTETIPELGPVIMRRHKLLGTWVEKIT